MVLEPVKMHKKSPSEDFRPNGGLPEFLTRQARQADLPELPVARSGWGRVVWPEKPQSRNFMHSTPPRGLKYKKKAIFVVRGSSLIGIC